jgi:diacylglycerol kinase (ATP)
VLCRIFGTVAATEKTQPGQAAVIYNPAKVSLPKLKKAVNLAAKKAGWSPVIWFETTEKDAGQRVTASAIGRGATLILVAGGDGTVRAVAEALRDRDVSMAVLPAGTGNLLARNLGLATSTLSHSISVAFGDTEKRIDLGIASIERDDGKSDDHVFLVMAGFGLDAKMIANTNSQLKKRVGWLAYVDAGVRSIPTLRPVRLRYRLDDAAERAINAHSIIIGNCGSLQGGIVLLPDAKLDDGLFDIVVLRPRGRFGWLRIWNKVTWENGVLRKSVFGRKIIGLSPEVKDLTYLRGADLRLRVEAAQAIQLDGDEFGEAVAIHSWVEPGALTVRVSA